MRAGKLRDLVAIQSVSEAQNATGEMIETWATFASVYGEVVPLRGQDRFEAAQLEEPVTGILVIRYLAGVTGKMRIVHDGVTYNIKGAPMVDAKKTRIEMYLEELPNG